MLKNDYVKIIDDIKSKLSGDNTKDLELLSSKIKKYQDHEHSFEIMKAIVALTSDRSDSMKDQIIREFTHLKQFRDRVLSEVQHKVSEHDLDGAEMLLELLLPYNEILHADETSEYFSFNNPIEYFY